MINENLLDSWINVSLAFKANRYLNDASLNEMLVLKEIIKNPNIRASELCNRVHMLKSQMSHLIENMKKKGYITSQKNEDDERKILLKVTDTGLKTYVKEHEIVLNIMSNVENKLGKKKAQDLCNLLNEATKIAKELR